MPVTPDTPFWIASITKTFVGLTFLDLVEDGVVRLDDPMAAVPGFDGFCQWLAASPLPFGRGLDCAGPITVRTVLTHTSNGTPGDAFLYNPLLFSASHAPSSGPKRLDEHRGRDERVGAAGLGARPWPRLG